MKIILLIVIYEVFGVKMMFFVGYNMFIFYSGFKEEYYQVCNSVGVFDVLYMGEFIIWGKEVFDFI